jgi:hypothetical protein
MASSSTVGPLARRWSRRVASLVGRSVLAALSVVVLAYGAIQGMAVTLRAMLPLAVSVSVSMPVPGAQSVSEWVSQSVGEMLTALETIPPVHLGPVMVDPVMNTASPLTVGVAIGFTALGCLGMGVASTPFRLSQRPSSPKEAALSVGRNARREIIAVFRRSQTEVAEGAETLFVLTGACVLMYWTASEMLLPRVADGAGLMMAVLLEIYVSIIPIVALLCGMGTIVHVIWYAGLRWRAQPSPQTDADSHRTSLDSEPSTDSEGGDD